MTWRVHPERDKKGAIKWGEWRYCTNGACTEEHFDYQPFRPIIKGI